MVEKKKAGLYGRFVKRGLDILIASLVIILFWWLYAILALLVRINLGSPVLFKQERPGKIDPATGKEKIFKMYKFRSMTDKRDENGNLLPGKLRLTKFGRFFRSTSLDELPEAFNILKGDMSLVGPRPLLVEYLPYYTAEERRRHSVRPGLTGWAQVNGRNNIASWEERFHYDLEYVDKCSLVFDIKVLYITVVKVFKRSDILVGSEIRAGRLDETRKARANDESYAQKV